MATANLNRSSVFAITSEDDAGTLKVISDATSYIPLKTGFSMDSATESLASDELLDSIGMAKPQLGKETPSGSHGAYLKNSETDGFPEYKVLLLSSLGSSIERSSEVAIVSAGTGSVTVADYSAFEVGEALLIEDNTNGWYIRNIESITTSTNTLNFNFNVDTATSSGTIKKNYMIKPVSSGHPSFSAWLRRSASAAVEAISGCQVNNVTMRMPAAGQAEIDFAYDGVNYYINPIVVNSANNKFDFMTGNRTYVATIPTDTYTPETLAAQLETQMESSDTEGNSYVIKYTPNGTNKGKFTFTTSTVTSFSLLVESGASSANSIAGDIGLTTDQSGAETYLSDTALNYIINSETPIYDGADNIVVKQADLYIGDSQDVINRKASEVSITIGTPSTDVDDITAKTGLLEKLKLSREVELTATLLLEKHESGLYDRFKNSTTVSAMVNIGPRTTNGYWAATKCFNAYLGNAVVSSHVIGGDDILTIQVTVKGFVDTGSLKDFYANFV